MKFDIFVCLKCGKEKFILFTFICEQHEDLIKKKKLKHIHFKTLTTNFDGTLGSSRKNSYPPQGRSLEIPRGRGVLKVKILEAKYDAKLEFPGGGEGAK